MTRKSHSEADDETNQQTVAVKSREIVVIEDVVGNLSISERNALRVWLEELLLIRNSDKNTLRKLRAISLSLRNSKSLLPIIRIFYEKLKEQAWDKRSPNGRWFVSASAAGILLFGFQGAGIAALGSAIGLPLFIVFGGGVTLAKLALDEILNNSSNE